MMQDLFGSVRRSLVFRPSASGDDAAATGPSHIAEKIGYCIRKSRAGLGLGIGQSSKLPSPPPPIPEAPQIRWRKGELIGCGAFGHVYMGMNLDSGELLAVKQVLIGTNNASKAKAQAHVTELEEEVKLLKNLSHPNIVRYLGTAREEDTLNILLEFVPGGSISSLLGKFGSFPEAVIRMYTKQLLQGLEYLHRYKIMHRDIKGANILVDNKGCIKLADFGASKQVAQLATITAAKSMKGTPYWMAPEVIVQSGHSFSADIWSVGCTVIEMATGKPPWSQQYQEVAALFHVGTTKSHPPIPEHLSSEAKDFLLKCLQQEPNLRPTAAELLQHPFVTGEYQDSHRSSAAKTSANVLPTSNSIKNLPSATCGGSEDVAYGTVNCSNMHPEKLFSSRPMWEMSADDEMCCLGDDNDDMCQLDDKDDFPVVGSSFNPMSEPFDYWPSKSGATKEPRTEQESGEKDFTFPCEPVIDDEVEVTETKIRAFLDEKAIDLKKLQTPLYEEFYNSLNASSCSVVNACKENNINNSKLPPKAKLSPSSKVVSGTTSTPRSDKLNTTTSPGNTSRRVSRSGTENGRVLTELHSPLNELGELIQDPQIEASCSSVSFDERRRKWKEELDRELELAREREMLRQAGVGGKSPSDKGLNQKRDHRSRFTSPAK